MYLSKNLIEYRKKCGLSQKDIAAKLNITRQAYNHYETGKRIPPVDTLNEIANILGVDINVLISGNSSVISREKEKLSEGDTYLLGIDGTRILITKEEQKKILNIIEAAMPEIFDNDKHEF
jgi:transcriptional regulator with XRE-family HTH domain